MSKSAKSSAQPAAESDLDTRMSLEERVCRLEDIRAIEQLKYSYVVCVDQIDVDGLASLFTEDGRWVSEQLGVDYGGRDAIRTYFANDDPRVPRTTGNRSDFVPWALHFLTAPQVELADDRQTAVGKFYLLGLQTARRADDPSDEEAVFLTINYIDQFVKENGRWYFKEINAIQHQTSDWTKGWVRDPWRGAERGISPWNWGTEKGMSPWQ